MEFSNFTNLPHYTSTHKTELALSDLVASTRTIFYAILGTTFPFGGCEGVHCSKMLL